MAKNGLIGILVVLLIASWIWPRFGTVTSEESSHPPRLETPEPPPAPPDPLEPLKESMAAMQAAPGFEAATIGFCVLGHGKDQPVFAYRADQAMTPASTLKAITSATALEILGPEYRFETALGSSTAFELDEAGVFHGDLIVRGGGDPFLTSRTLSVWTKELRDKGLRKIEGRLLGDGRHFPERLIPDAWDWGDVSNYYGAGPSGLNLDRNRFSVMFEPGKTVGETASVSLDPGIEHHNFTITTAAETPEWTSIYGGPYSNILTFRGSIPLDARWVSARGAVPDPTLHAVSSFENILEGVSIDVTQAPTTFRRLKTQGETDYPNFEQELLRHESEPLLEIVHDLNHTSDNLVTECVYQQLQTSDPLGRAGQDLVTSHWEARGMEFKGLRMEDGSGLARADAIRPVDLARVLWLTRRGPQGDAFFHTLPLNHGGAVRWKGGAMSKVRAYTGYTENGYTFALMINQYAASAEALANWRAQLLDHVLALPRVLTEVEEL